MSAPVGRGQGMGREPVVPDWPPLRTGEAAAVLARWGLRAVRVGWRSPRPFSAAALVEVDGGTQVFLKRHHHLVRTPASLRASHAFSRHLRGRGQPVAEVLATPDGATAVAEGEWTYELQARAPGCDRYRDALAWTPYRDAGDAAGAGAALGRLHRAAAGFGDPSSPAVVLAGGNEVAASPDPLAAVEGLVARRPALSAWLAGRDWRAQLGPLLDAWPPAPRGDLWGHGDWHATNLLWRGSEVAAVLDLALAAPTGAAWDVAVALERAVVGWLDLAEGATAPVDHRATAAFLAGYRGEADLDAAAVAAALPLCHVDFALSEVEYFAGVVGSPANAALAWDGYLCGHLGWWAGASGRALLEAVKGAGAP